MKMLNSFDRHKELSKILKLFSFYRSEPAAGNKQYVLVYPSYQFVSTRQDDSANSGFFESIQNYFINFGNSQQMDEPSQVMDAVEPDKQESAQSTKTVVAPEEKPFPTKQKFFYSYATPASTVPLNADRRFFYLAEQPQVYGTFSGSAINPVFNLQPVPVVLSRSNNVAQPDEPHPNKVITENVQKFSQIPPVMATVEQLPEVQAKSVIAEQVNSIVDDPLPESKVAPVAPVVPVEDNRAVPVPTEPSVQVTPEVVVEARSNAIPLTISSEPIAPIVASPVVDGVVEGIEPVQPIVEPVVASLKEVPSVVPVARLEPIVPAVPAAGDQSVQVSEEVESVTASV